MLSLSDFIKTYAIETHKNHYSQILRLRLCSKHSKIRILQRNGSLLASDWRIHPHPLCVCGASPMGSDSKIQKTTPTDLHLETSIRLMRNVWDIISHKIPEDMRKTLDHNIRPNGFVRSHDVSRSLLTKHDCIQRQAYGQNARATKGMLEMNVTTHRTWRHNALKKTLLEIRLLRT